MGTNYYARKIPTKKRREELCDLIMNTNDFRSILEEVNSTYTKAEYPSEIEEGKYGVIHLGKASAGWKFLWNPNIYKLRQGHTEKTESGSRWIEDPPKALFIYPLTKAGIKAYIDQPDIEVYDEYGEKQDKEEFWNYAINHITWYNRKTGKEEEAWDGKAYELAEPSKYHFGLNEYNLWLRELGYNVEWPYTDFYSDGLRFAAYGCDFS